MHYSTHFHSSPSVAKAHVEHEALIRGQVVSIVSGYGFIRDNQGVSYYMNLPHLNQRLQVGFPRFAGALVV